MHFLAIARKKFEFYIEIHFIVYHFYLYKNAINTVVCARVFFFTIKHDKIGLINCIFWFCICSFAGYHHHPTQLGLDVDVKIKMRIFIWIPGILGIIGPIFIPIVHMLVLFWYWQSYARFVDRRFCSCSCWDTVRRICRHWLIYLLLLF